MVPSYCAVLLALSVAGCAASAQVGQNTGGIISFASAFPPGHLAIDPTPKLKVGQIYRRGGKEVPAIVINGSTYTPLCPIDFKETRGLNNITVTEEKRAAAFTDSFSAGANASLGGIPLASLIASFSAGGKSSGSIAMKDLIIVDAGDDILPYVIKLIGPKCRDAIAGNLKNGNPVIIVVQGYRAGEITVTRGNTASGQLGTAGGGIFPNGSLNYEHNQSATVEKYFISLKPASVPSP